MTSPQLHNGFKTTFAQHQAVARSDWHTPICHVHCMQIDPYRLQILPEPLAVAGATGPDEFVIDWLPHRDPSAGARACYGAVVQHLLFTTGAPPSQHICPATVASIVGRQIHTGMAVREVSDYGRAEEHEAQPLRPVAVAATSQPATDAAPAQPQAVPAPTQPLASATDTAAGQQHEATAQPSMQAAFNMPKACGTHELSDTPALQIRCPWLSFVVVSIVAFGHQSFLMPQHIVYLACFSKLTDRAYTTGGGKLIVSFKVLSRRNSHGGGETGHSTCADSVQYHDCMVRM